MSPVQLLCAAIRATRARPGIRVSAPLALVLLLPSPQSTSVPAPAAPTAVRSSCDTRSLLAQARYPAAELCARAAIAQHPGQAEPHLLLGYILYKQRRWIDSLAAYTAAAQLRPPQANDLLTIAADYIQLGSYPDAERWLLMATRLSPLQPESWYLLARTQYNLGHDADAQASFLTCLKLQPDHLRARYNLGLAYERLNRPDDAALAYQQAIAMQANAAQKDAQPELDLGMLLVKRSQPEAALPHLDEAVRLAPRNPMAHEQRAFALEKLNRLAEAAADMAECNRLDPQAQAPLFFLGRLYRHLGRDADAREQFAKAQQLAGTHSTTEVRNILPDPQ